MGFIRGNKHVCSECNTKFFDLGQEEPFCPKCQTKIILKQSKEKKDLITPLKEINKNKVVIEEDEDEEDINIEDTEINLEDEHTDDDDIKLK